MGLENVVHLFQLEKNYFKSVDFYRNLVEKYSDLARSLTEGQLNQPQVEDFILIERSKKA